MTQLKKLPHLAQLVKVPAFVAVLSAATFQPAVYAQAALKEFDYTAYAKLNVSLDKVDLEDVNGTLTRDNVELDSNASRIGVKGGFALAGATRAIFQIELEVFLDDGDDGSAGGNSEFKQRNSYAGFSGNWGKIIAGKHDTPVKIAQGGVDRFNDLRLGDIRNVMQGENRADNIIMLFSPTRRGFTSSAAFIPGEQDGVASSTGNGPADGVSVALGHANAQHSISLAYDNGRAIASTVKSLLRAVGEYRFERAAIGALYQKADQGATDERAYLLSGQYQLTDTLAIKAQYADSDNDSVEKMQIAVGADYKLGNAARLFSYYSQIDNKASASGGPSSTNRSIGLGYEINF